MGEPLRLPKGKILRCKTQEGAKQIFAIMPEGASYRDRNEVVLLQPVLMRVEIDPASLPKPDPVRTRPFLFDR